MPSENKQVLRLRLANHMKNQSRLIMFLPLVVFLFILSGPLMGPLVKVIFQVIAFLAPFFLGLLVFYQLWPDFMSGLGLVLWIIPSMAIGLWLVDKIEIYYQPGGGPFW